MKTAQRNRRQPTRVTAKFDQRSGLVRLNVPLSVKADSIDSMERTFEGLAATWDEDLGNDVIVKGAFKKSIAEWKTSGEAMPLLNSHDHYDIFAALGQALTMKETNEGLLIKWEVIEGEDGDKVLSRLRPSPRTGRAIIGKMSIGFVPTKFMYEQPEGTDSFWDRKRIINEADLMEVSLVLFPMNPNASIDATTVKSFLKMAHDTDPRKLDGITRMELRRLNSRIGLLLKKQKPEDDEEESEDIADEQTPSSTQQSADTRTATDSDDDADDAGDSEDTDEELDDTSDEEADDTEGSEDAPEPKSAKGTKDTKKDEVDVPKPYLFGEALKSRLQKVALQHKIGPK